MAGIAGSTAAALVFATAHALLIVPIWGRVAGGMLLPALAGAACGHAFAVLYPEMPGGGCRSAVRLGARYGALLWLAVAPVSLADMLLRAVGVAPRYDAVAVTVAIALAIGAGATLGYRIAGTRHAAVAGAVATLLLTCAMAGPVPIGRDARALGIWLAVLPACVVAGSVLASTLRLIVPTPHSPRPTDATGSARPGAHPSPS